MVSVLTDGINAISDAVDDLEAKNARAKGLRIRRQPMTATATSSSPQ